MPGPTLPRAFGERIDYAAAPSAVRQWVDSELGSPVVAAATQVGGMSPGPAARLELADGRRFFVKAVGSGLNPHTPRLFRRELDVLRLLPPVDYRPSLVAAYDDGDWVALVLEDVDGRHPDLSDPAVMGEARRVVRAQSHALTPDQLRLPGPDLAATVRRWHATIAAVDHGRHRPAARARHLARRDRPRPLSRRAAAAHVLPARRVRPPPRRSPPAPGPLRVRAG